MALDELKDIVDQTQDETLRIMYVLVRSILKYIVQPDSFKTDNLSTQPAEVIKSLNLNDLSTELTNSVPLDNMLKQTLFYLQFLKRVYRDYGVENIDSLLSSIQQQVDNLTAESKKHAYHDPHIDTLADFLPHLDNK